MNRGSTQRNCIPWDLQNEFPVDRIKRQLPMTAKVVRPMAVVIILVVLHSRGHLKDTISMTTSQVKLTNRMAPVVGLRKARPSLIRVMVIEAVGRQRRHSGLEVRSTFISCIPLCV